MYISALLLPESKPRRAVDTVVRQGKDLLSFAALAELYGVLSRKQLRQYLDENDVRTFLAALTPEAEWIELTTTITACRDPKDNKFLERGIDGSSTRIITVDSDLLALHPFQEIAIVSPELFLRSL